MMWWNVICEGPHNEMHFVGPFASEGLAGDWAEEYEIHHGDFTTLTAMLNYDPREVLVEVREP